MHCLKSASKAAVPVDKVRIGTRKPNWNVDPEVKRAKQKAKFWLRMWISCDNNRNLGQLYLKARKLTFAAGDMALLWSRVKQLAQQGIVGH